MYYCQELEIFSLKRTSNYDFINIYAHGTGKFDTWIVTRIKKKNTHVMRCDMKSLPKKKREMWHEMITVEIRWDISVIPQSATKAKNLWKDLKKTKKKKEAIINCRISRRWQSKFNSSRTLSFCHSCIGLDWRNRGAEKFAINGGGGLVMGVSACQSHISTGIV